LNDRSDKAKIVEKNEKNNHSVQCDFCKWDKPFDMPSEIITAYRTGKLAIFAGGGVSTESKGVFPSSFYEEIRNELRIPKEKQISFSNLMSLYCSPPRSRKDLIKAIKKRIDYAQSFPELYYRATEFHQELSTIPHLDEIFTTNWDDFFERECNATPIVTGEDFAILHDASERKVFKLHGSIYNFGSIVATREDYNKCYRLLSKGIIGASLKLHLISKTLVFLGFSFDDEDFQQMYNFLQKDVHGLVPRSYVVTLDDDAKKKLEVLGINATLIVTSATHFIHEFKKKLVSEKLMVPDQQFEGIERAIEEVRKEHYKLSSLELTQHPDALYSLSYQDGLLHSFERLLATKKSGENSCATHIAKIINYYESLIKGKIRKGYYPDVAYFTGYLSGLLYFLLDDKKRNFIPTYFLFVNNDINNLEQFLAEEKNAPQSHKAAHKLAVKLTRNIPKDFVYHHTPFS
jgi:hypothetical protein